MSGTTRISLPGRFTALDGWRGTCALLVALYHFHTTSHIEQLPLVRHAYLLVDFFFVLSGFVITSAYFDRLNDMRDIGIMLWRRLGRLWPLHLAMLGAFIALELGIPLVAAVLGTERSAAAAFDPQSSALLAAIPTNVLLLHGLGIHDRLTWNIPSWSISTEVWTYAAFAVIVVLARGWMLVAAVVLAGLGAAVVAACSPVWLATDFDFGLWRCLYGFFIGHLVWRLATVMPIRLGRPTLVEAAVVLGLGLFVSYCGRTPLELAAPVVFAVAVLVFAQEKGHISRLLKSLPFTVLGLISYSIYMVHALLVTVAHRGMTVIEQATGVLLTAELAHAGGTVRAISFGNAYVMDLLVVLYLAAVVGLAGLSWRWIEMPAQRWWNGLIAVRRRERSGLQGRQQGGDRLNPQSSR